MTHDLGATSVFNPGATLLDGKLVSVDIETSGLDALKHDTLEVAAIVFNLDPANLREDRFHCFVKHDVVRWDPDTFDFHMKNGYFDYVRSEAVRSVPRLTPYEVFNQLSGFLVSTGVYDDKVKRGGGATAVGKNFGSFDLQFLMMLDPRFRGRSVFKHRDIDVGNLLWNPLVDKSTLPSSEVCAERMGVGAAGVKHRAMDDAALMADMTRKSIMRLISAR